MSACLAPKILQRFLAIIAALICMVWIMLVF
jgi:hypothetical protein